MPLSPQSGSPRLHLPPLKAAWGLWLFSFSLLLSASGSAAAIDELFDRAVEAHERGVEGDAAAVDQALTWFETILETDPKHAEALAFFGSACTLKARDASIFERMNWVRKGTEAMDRAVKMAPQHIGVRTVRAINSYQLPSFLGRRSTADEDFATLRQWAEERPDDFEPSLLRFVLFHAGVHAYQRRDASSVSLLARALTLPANISVPDEKIREMKSRAERRFGKDA